MADKGSKPIEHVIIRDWCKGCGLCVHFCPKHVLELDAEDKVYAARPGDCIGCGMCEMRCPDLCISIVTGEEGGAGSRAGDDALCTGQ